MSASERRRRLTAFVVAMAVLTATPLAVVAADAFTDVPATNVHHDDITWLRDNGVTFGCNPPDNTEFCPGEPVLRQQMASFMRRLAENRIVDAATAATADDAEMLDGQDSMAYETNVMAESCGIEVAPGPTAETTCLPSSGGVIGAGVNAEVLSFNISADAASALQLSSTSLSQTTIAWSFTLNAGCSGNLETLLNRAVNGHIWGNTDAFSTAAHLATNIPAGTHTVRLCGFNSGAAPVDLLTASLTTQWTAGGSVSVAGTGGSSPVDMPALLQE